MGAVIMFRRREFLAASAAAAVSGSFSLTGCDIDKTDVTFANPTPVWWNAVPIIAERHGFYASEKVNVVGFEVPNGVRSKQAIVDGNAQMGVASPNAIPTSTDLQLEKLRILASITQSNSTIALVSRKPVSEILNSRIGYVKGAISEFYLI